MKFLIRRLKHKVDNEQKTSERYIMNTTYKNPDGLKETKILFPLPDCVEQRCSCPNCNEVAICMDEYFRAYCSRHIYIQFPETEVTQDKVLIVPSVDQAVRGNAFEWQVEGKEDWYKVKGSNIGWDSTQRLSVDEIKKRWDEVMYQVLTDNPQLVEGDYKKEEKKLIIHV